MIRPVTERSSPFRRLTGAAGLFLLVGIFFALPLWAALSICSMPCCHRAPAAGIGAPMSGMPCSTDCTISADELRPVTAPTVQTAPLNALAAAPLTATLASAAPKPLPADSPSRDGDPPPVHLLLSVFRI